MREIKNIEGQGPFLLKPIEPMNVGETSFSFERLNFGKSRGTIEPFEMAEDNIIFQETSLKRFDQAVPDESKKLEKFTKNELTDFARDERSKYSTYESLTTEIADLSDPIEDYKPGLLVAKGHVNGSNASFLFDTGCTRNIISLDFCKKFGIKYRIKKEYMAVWRIGQHKK